MKPNIRDIYEHVANLFYAFSLDRGAGVSSFDLASLELLTGSYYWAPESSRPSSISAERHQILLPLEGLPKENASKRDAYSKFERFFLSYQELFSIE